MRRHAIVAILVTLPTVLALACEPGPTPPPEASPAPSATSQPVQPTVVVTPSPTTTATPIPELLSGPIDLGVPAGDAYGPRAMVVDGERGLAFVVSSYGDGAPPELGDVSLLSVVDITPGVVRDTIPLPNAFSGTTSLALAPAGDRLFIAGGDDDRLLVVATGAGSEPLGAVVAVKTDVRAFALDPASSRLYTVGANRIRVLDADTLQELSSGATPAGLAAPPSDVFVAVNSQTSRLYLASPNNDVVPVLRIDDLRKVADIRLAGRPEAIVAGHGSAQAYLLMRVWPEGIEQMAVVEGDQVARVWEPQEGFAIRGVVPDDLSDQAFLWETGSEGEARLRSVDPVSGEMVAVMALPTQRITEARVTKGRVYLLTWDNVLITVALDDGDVEGIVKLGVTLRDAILDEPTGRLLVLDSFGTVRVLEAASLQHVTTWPHVVGTGADSVYAVPLSLVGRRLFVPDYDADETVVLDVTTGERLAAIPKAGQVTFDPSRTRLFVTTQGVFIVEPETYTVVGSIDETVRKTMFSGEPSGVAAQYDVKHDLLFVTMSNNAPGSSARTWLQIYDGETRQRLDTAIQTDQQFLSGLAIDTTTDRVYVASSFPGYDLAVFSIGGELLTRLQFLSGQVFLDEANGRLYITGWNGLVTLDTTNDPLTGSGLSVIAYRRLLPAGYREFTLFDVQRERFYTTLPNTADLYVFSPRAPDLLTPLVVGRLPPEQILYLAVAADGAVFAVNAKGTAFQQAGNGWVVVSETLPPAEWPVIDPAPGAARVAFAYLRQAGQAFGLFRTVDGGRAWQPAVRGLRDFDVRDLALSPDFAVDGTAYLLAGEDGVFRSVDGGDTWQRISSIAGQYIALASAASGPAALLVLARDPAVYDQTLVYAPADGSDALEQIGTIEAGVLAGSDDLALSPDFARDGIAIAGLFRSGLFLSQDSGRTWRQLPPRPEAFSTGYTIRFSPEFAVDRTIYALLAPSYFGQGDRSWLYRSTDGGETWVRAVDADPLMSALAMGPAGELWAGDTQGNVAPLDPLQLTWETVRESTPTPVPTPAGPPAGFYQPETDPDIQPPTGREQPVRGFGKVWREQSGARERLGWALEAEAGYTSPVQAFERGTAIGIGSSVYVLTRVAGEPATWLGR